MKHPSIITKDDFTFLLCIQLMTAYGFDRKADKLVFIQQAYFFVAGVDDHVHDEKISRLANALVDLYQYLSDLDA